MLRHFPSLVFMAVELKARVADRSGGLASVAAEGLRTVPARETGMGAFWAWVWERGLVVVFWRGWSG